MNHVSLKDVAARAGVTFPVVSKVFKGKGTVSSETRVAILQAAEELGYVPNAVARSLANQKTSIIERRVPEDCAIVGCDDLVFSARVFPSIHFTSCGTTYSIRFHGCTTYQYNCQSCRFYNHYRSFASFLRALSTLLLYGFYYAQGNVL